MKLKLTRKTLTLCFVALLVSTMVAFPVWRLTMLNLRQTHTLPGGETVTLISWSYGKKHRLALHDSTTPIWLQLLAPPVLSELNTEEDRLVVWFKIDFPKRGRNKHYYSTEFPIEIKDDLGQSIYFTLKKENKFFHKINEDTVYFPLNASAFPRGSNELTLRFLTTANGPVTDFHIPNPNPRSVKLIKAIDQTVRPNGGFSASISGFKHSEPEFYVNTKGENYRATDFDSSGLRKSCLFPAAGEKYRVRPIFKAFWNGAESVSQHPIRWRLFDSAGNEFLEGDNLDTFIAPKVVSDLKAEVWFRGTPEKAGASDTIWDAGIFHTPGKGSRASIKSSYDKNGSIDHIRLLGTGTFTFGKENYESLETNTPCVRVQYKPQYPDDKLYLETTDEKGVSFPHHEMHELFYTEVTEGNTNWLVPKRGFVTQFIRSGPNTSESSYGIDPPSQKEKQTISFFMDLPKGVKKFHLKFGIAHARKVEFIIPPIR